MFLCLSLNVLAGQNFSSGVHELILFFLFTFTWLMALRLRPVTSQSVEYSLEIQEVPLSMLNF